MKVDLNAEWLEADGQGGFAMGTAGLVRTRRYHGLLTTARVPPTGRMVLISGVEAWAGFPLSAARYASGTTYPDVTYPGVTYPAVTYPGGQDRLASFTAEPWPTWVFDSDGVTIEHSLFVEPTGGATVLRWRVLSGVAASLTVRPLLAVRDYHALRREGPIDLTPTGMGQNVSWRPDGIAIGTLSTGAYAHDPMWFRNVLYTTEQARGLDCVEDVASPGVFTFDLAAHDAVLIFRQGDSLAADALAHAAVLEAAERTRRAAPDRLARSAGSYMVARGSGRTILAGFPWFTDWGRDTFISLRGLLLGTGHGAAAAAILHTWAELIDGGMVPNRFPDDGGAPEYNTVDGALWFCVAVHDVLAAGAGGPVLRDAVERVIDGHIAGTRYGIGVDADGLVHAGAPGQQLTWMDAKYGDTVVTPRHGKPVEIQALWINALRSAGQWTSRFASLERTATVSLAQFHDPATGGLADVLHPGGTQDRSVRPNQIFAVGGLPFQVVHGPAAAAIVDLVEARLLTPMGLRTLDPADPAYCPRYEGGVVQRDSAYHQGTVWPWLMGAYVQAALRVRGPAAIADLRAQCLAPLLAHLDANCGHVCEVAHGTAPHTPGGCPAQAWSLGELIRIRGWLA